MSTEKSRNLKPGYSSLVISRWSGQGVLIGEHILVEVMKRRDSGIQMRIIAPRDLEIFRTEAETKPFEFYGYAEAQEEDVQ